jgi:hypothetical protein
MLTQQQQSKTAATVVSLPAHPADYSLASILPSQSVAFSKRNTISTELSYIRVESEEEAGVCLLMSQKVEGATLSFFRNLGESEVKFPSEP